MPRGGARVGAGDHGEDDPQRARERALKRFQLVTKVADPAVGAVYLALYPGEPGPSGGASGAVGGGGGGGRGGGGSESGGEGEGDAAAYRAGDAGGRAGVSTEKKAPPAGGGPEASGLAHFFDDEEWERNAAAPARGRRGTWRVVAPVLPQGVKAEAPR